MRFKHNLRKKLFFLLSSFVLILSSLIVGISAYFVSKVSVSASFTVDISAPQLTIETPLGDSVSSPVYVTSPIVSIKGSATDSGSEIKSLTVNGKEVSVGSDGSWSTNITLSENISTQITIIVTDESGKTTNKTGYLCYDSKNPTLGITTVLSSDSANPTKVTNETLSLEGTYGDANGIASVKVNGVEATCNNGKWNTSVSLTPNVTTTLTITVTDSAGRTTTLTRYVYYNSDNVAPNLTISSSTYSSSTSYIITGTVSDTNGITSVKINNSISATINSDGTWSANITLTDKSDNTLHIVATDTSGNTKEITHIVGCNNDTTGPTLTIINPGSAYTGSGTAYITVSGGYVVSGTISDHQSGVASVIVDGKEATINGNNWSVPITDSDGESRVILVEAMDQAGNRVTNNIRVIFENHHPDWAFTYCYGSKTSPYMYNQTTSITVQLEASSYHNVSSVTFNGIEAVKRDNYGGYSYVVNKDEWGEDVIAEYEVIVHYKDGTSSKDYTYAVYSPKPVITANRNNTSSSPYYIDSKTDGDLILSGTVTDTGGITSFTIKSENGGPIEIPLAEDGSYSYNIGDLLTQSLFAVTSVELRAVDIWGNVTTKTIYFKWYI